jgi:hypothetical protein
MKHVLAAVLLVALAVVAPATHAEAWKETVYEHVYDGYFGGYWHEEIISLAAQDPVEDDILQLHEAFVAAWAQAQDEQPDILLGQFVMQADRYYQALEDEFAGSNSTSSIRTRGTTGGF